MQSLSGTKEKLFYGWVVVATFLIIGTPIWGLRLSFGVFFKSLESEFNLTRTATSGIFSVYLLLGGIFTILGGRALDKYGPGKVIFLMGILTGFGLLLTSQTNSLWQLYITYGVILSMGTSAIFTVVMSTTSRWFDRMRGLAVGIAGSGGGVGPVVMAPFATFLISSFGWRMAFLIIGVIIWIVVIPLSRLLKKDPEAMGLLPDGVKLDSVNTSLQRQVNVENNISPASLSLLQAFKTRNFWFIMFVFVFHAFSHLLILTHLVPHAMDIGFSAAEAAIVLSVMGGTQIAGRVLMGNVADRMGKKVTAIICESLQTGAVAWLIWSRDLWMLYLFAIAYGFTWGGIGSSLGALVGDAFGLGKIGTMFGILDVGFAVGAAIGPAVGGLIFDVSNSYTFAFLLGVVTMLIVILFTALIRRETNRTTYHYTTGIKQHART